MHQSQIGVTEVVARWCSIKKVCPGISQNSPENTCVRERHSEFCDISRRAFYRAPPMATYGVNTNSLLQPLFLFFGRLFLLFDQMLCNTRGISTFNELCTLFCFLGKPYNKTRQNLHVKIKQKEIHKHYCGKNSKRRP